MVDGVRSPGCSTDGCPVCFHANSSETQEDLETQVTLVENLRRYVGEQVPPKVHSQAWEPERQELLNTVQVEGAQGCSCGGAYGESGQEMVAALGGKHGPNYIRQCCCGTQTGCYPRAGMEALTGTALIPPAALAGGPGQPAGHCRVAAGTGAEPHAHAHPTGGGADQKGNVLPRQPSPARLYTCHLASLPGWVYCQTSNSSYCDFCCYRRTEKRQTWNLFLYSLRSHFSLFFLPSGSTFRCLGARVY
jgi:hypothetical protein